MKKVFYNLIAICVIVASCKKDHTKPNNPVLAKQKVTFTVGFSQTSINLGLMLPHHKASAINSTPDTSLTNNINTLYYMVFDSAGNNVQNLTQLVTDTAFGHYTDNLQPGKYTVAVAGVSSDISLQAGTLNTEYLYNLGNSNAYFQRVSLAVGNSPLTQAFSLTRINSELKVVIQDAIPANATYLSLKLTNIENQYFVGNDSTAFINTPQTTYTYTIPTSAEGTTNYTVSGYFLYHDAFSVEILCANNSGQATIYGDKIVYNVTARPNAITTLTGNLFTGGGTTNGAHITADTAFTSTTVVNFH